MLSRGSFFQIRARAREDDPVFETIDRYRQQTDTAQSRLEMSPALCQPQPGDIYFFQWSPLRSTSMTSFAFISPRTTLIYELGDQRTPQKTIKIETKKKRFSGGYQQVFFHLLFFPQTFPTPHRKSHPLFIFFTFT